MSGISTDPVAPGRKGALLRRGGSPPDVGRVETGAGVLHLAAPVPLFRVDSASFGSYDVAPDGQRFLRSPSVGALPITVALGWKAQVDW